MLVVLIRYDKRWVLRAPQYGGFFGALTTISSASWFPFCSRDISVEPDFFTQGSHAGSEIWELIRDVLIP